MDGGSPHPATTPEGGAGQTMAGSPLAVCGQVGSSAALVASEPLDGGMFLLLMAGVGRGIPASRVVRG